MNNYFVFENRKTKERVIVKEIRDRVLKLYRLKNGVVNSEFIDWRDLRQLRRDELLKLVCRYKSYSEMPAVVDFRIKTGIDISAVIIDEFGGI